MSDLLSKEERDLLEKQRIEVQALISQSSTERIYRGVKKGQFGSTLKVEIKIVNDQEALSHLEKEFNFMSQFLDRRILVYHLFIKEIRAVVTDSTTYGTLDNYLGSQTGSLIPTFVVRLAKQLRDGYQFLSDRKYFCKFTTKDIFLTESLDLKLGRFENLQCSAEESVRSFGKLLIQLETYGKTYEETTQLSDFSNFQWPTCDPSYKQLALLAAHFKDEIYFQKDPYQIAGAALEGVSKNFGMLPKVKPLYQRLRDEDFNRRLNSIIKSNEEVTEAWEGVITALAPPKPKAPEPISYNSREKEFEEIRKAVDLSLQETEQPKKLSDSQELKRAIEASLLEEAPYQLTAQDIQEKIPMIQSIMGNECPTGKIIAALEATRGDAERSIEKLLDPSFEWAAPPEEKPVEPEPEPEPVQIEYDYEDIAFLGVDGPTEANEKQEAIFAVGKLRQVLSKNLKVQEWHIKKAALESIEFTQSYDQSILSLVISIATDPNEEDLVRTVAKDTLEKFAPSIDQIINVMKH